MSMMATPHHSPIIHRYLPNGMEVYLYPTDFAPVTSLHVLVKVGSIDEDDHEGGVAHVLEHMLFKGTEKFPAVGQIASTVEEAGGDINAYTTFDHTNYHMTVPAKFALDGAELLVDIVQNSLLDEEELKKELEVVLEEIRRSDDHPNRVVTKNMFTSFFAGTRLARPVIGYRDIVAGFTRQLVYNFYKKWYLPNNMIFIAAGDFNPSEMYTHLLKLTEGFLPGSVPPKNRPVVQPFSLPPRSISHLERGAWQEIRVQLAVSAPSLEDDETPLWDVLSSILGQGDSSRLSRTLKDELQLVTAIDSFCFTPDYASGMFGITFFCMAEKSHEVLQQVVEEVRRLAETSPSPDELRRVLSTLKAQRIYTRESMDGIARNAGSCLQTSRKMNFEDDYLEAVARVTPEDVRKTASKVLKSLAEEKFCLSAAAGKDVSETITAESLKSVIQKSATLATTHHHSKGKNNEESIVFSAGATLRHSSWNSNIRQLTLPLPGDRVLRINHRRSQYLPVVSGVLALRGGLTLEQPGKNGTGSLAMTMLTRGTIHQSYHRFVEELEDNAASISAFSTRDLSGIQFDSLSENSLRTFRMFLDCFFQPEFSASEWERVHREKGEILVARKDSPSALLSAISRPLLFPDHPYANDPAGNLKSLPEITRENVLEFHQRCLCSREFVLSLAGDFSLESFLNVLEPELHRVFQSAPLAESHLVREESRRPLLTDRRFAFHFLEREQSHLLLAFRTLPISDPRRTALEVAANILGGQGGRLFLDLRDSRSLAYSLGASHSPGILGGHFSLSIGTASYKWKEALAGLKEHIENLACHPPTEAEVARAAASILGSINIESQHHSYQASQLAMSDVCGLEFDNFLGIAERVYAVTPQAVSEVLYSIMKENPPLISIVGNQNFDESQKLEESFLQWNLI